MGRPLALAAAVRLGVVTALLAGPGCGAGPPDSPPDAGTDSGDAADAGGDAAPTCSPADDCAGCLTCLGHCECLGTDPEECGWFCWPSCDRPEADPGGPLLGRALAVRRWYLGATERDGTPSFSAWRDYGFDLDGLKSSRESTDHCQPVAGASPASVKTDGNGGRDNSFGAHLLALLDTLAGDAQAAANLRIADGRGTALVLSSAFEAPASVGVRTAWVEGVALASPPRWDGTDAWPTRTSSWGLGSASGTPAVMAPGVLDRCASDPVIVVDLLTQLVHLDLEVLGIAVRLPIHHPVVVVETGPPGTVAPGMLGGVLLADEVMAALTPLMVAYDPALCDPGTTGSIASQVRTAADIMRDRSNGDPSLTCDAISIGLAFEAEDATLGAIAPDPPPSAGCPSP